MRLWSGGMSTQFRLAMLVVLCVARAVTADFNLDTPGSRRWGHTPAIGHGPGHPGHSLKDSHGHKLRAQRPRPSLQSHANPKPRKRKTLREKVVSEDMLNKYNRSDCDVHLHSSQGSKESLAAMMKNVNYVLCQYYGPWSSWRPCNRKCLQRRVRKCQVPEQCGATKLKEHRPCRRRRGRCSSVAKHAVKYFHQQNQPRIGRALYEAFYDSWTPWSACTRSCKQRRRRVCMVREVCQNDLVQQNRRCSVPGSRCERKHKPRPPKATEAAEETASTTASPAVKGLSSTTTEQSSVQKKGGNRKPRPKPRKNGKYGGDQDKEDREEAESGEEELWTAQRNCGLRPPAKRGSYRVVGGQEAQRLSWPWQVAILTRWQEQYCAGTLISPQWILTAAHCVRKRGRRRRIVVRAGEHNLAEFEGSEEDLKPQREYPHPHFDYTTITNDIALVRLRTPIKERSHPGYACLPDPGFTPDRESLCYVIGWGKRRNTHLFGAEVLQEAELPLVTRRQCQRMFDYHINDTQVCAGFRRGGKDACDGDSGGPLLCPKTSAGVTRWFLVGITSYGEGCGRRGKFGIYTRVTSYLGWINDTTRLH